MRPPRQVRAKSTASLGCIPTSRTLADLLPKQMHAAESGEKLESRTEGTVYIGYLTRVPFISPPSCDQNASITSCTIISSGRDEGSKAKGSETLENQKSTLTPSLLLLNLTVHRLHPEIPLSGHVLQSLRAEMQILRERQAVLNV